LEKANNIFTRDDQILLQRFQCLRNRRKAHGFLIPALHQQVVSVDLCADILNGFVAGAKEEDPSNHGTVFPINILDWCRRSEAVFFAAAEYDEHLRNNHHTVATQIDATDLLPLQVLQLPFTKERHEQQRPAALWKQRCFQQVESILKRFGCRKRFAFYGELCYIITP